MFKKILRTLTYVVNRFAFRKSFLIAKSDRNDVKLRFKTEDVVGRHIYKRGDYEKHLSDFISDKINFENGDVALDIGANIGWYSLLLSRLMPEASIVYAFEPDPLNYELLSHNIRSNAARNVVPVNCAVSDKKEIKRLYRYSNNNLGRHSLLDINSANYVEVQANVLDDFLSEMRVDFSRIKFIKIDIEGYEYFALCGAKKAIHNVKFLISEFVPRHMKKGGVEPGLLIDLLVDAGLKPNVIINGKLMSVTKHDLLQKDACDIVWIR